MPFKSIVTFVTDAEADKDATLTAAAVADAHQAHLTAVCLGLDRTNPGAYYAGANAIVLQESLKAAQDEAAATETAVDAALGVWTCPTDTVSVTAQIGAIAPLIGDHAVLADLIVLPKPYGDGRDVQNVVVTEAALFRTRVPVLIVPKGHQSNIAPKRVVIAWNESPEALAAIRGALEMLRAADTVDIAIIDPPQHGADRSDPGGALAEMLARHGVRADVSVLPKTMPRVSDVLARHCEDREAELLVMGAYGHSRLREAILGGATRNTLELARIPVLMAH